MKLYLHHVLFKQFSSLVYFSIFFIHILGPFLENPFFDILQSLQSMKLCLHHSSCKIILESCVFFHVLYTYLSTFLRKPIFFHIMQSFQSIKLNLHHASYQTILDPYVFFHIFHIYLMVSFRKPLFCISYNHYCP